MLIRGPMNRKGLKQAKEGLKEERTILLNTAKSVTNTLIVLLKVHVEPPIVGGSIPKGIWMSRGSGSVKDSVMPTSKRKSP